MATKINDRKKVVKTTAQNGSKTSTENKRNTVKKSRGQGTR